jgi:hypothetical protein
MRKMINLKAILVFCLLIGFPEYRDCCFGLGEEEAC